MPNEDTVIHTPDGERIRIMGGDETVAQLLSVDHLKTNLRKMGCDDLAAWMDAAKRFEEEEAA